MDNEKIVEAMSPMFPDASTRFAKHLKERRPPGRVYELEMIGIQSFAAATAIEEAYRDGFAAGLAAAADQC